MACVVRSIEPDGVVLLEPGLTILKRPRTGSAPCPWRSEGVGVDTDVLWAAPELGAGSENKKGFSSGKMGITTPDAFWPASDDDDPTETMPRGL